MPLFVAARSLPFDQLCLALRDDFLEVNRLLCTNYGLNALYFQDITMQQIEQCLDKRCDKESDLLTRYLMTPWSQREKSLLHTMISIDEAVCGDPVEELRLGLLDKELNLGTHILDACQGMSKQFESIAAQLG